LRACGKCLPLQRMMWPIFAARSIILSRMALRDSMRAYFLLQPLC
jgi:hypothetical protein